MVSSLPLCLFQNKIKETFAPKRQLLVRYHHRAASRNEDFISVPVTSKPHLVPIEAPFAQPPKDQVVKDREHYVRLTCLEVSEPQRVFQKNVETPCEMSRASGSYFSVCFQARVQVDRDCYLCGSDRLIQAKEVIDIDLMVCCLGLMPFFIWNQTNDEWVLLKLESSQSISPLLDLDEDDDSVGLFH